MASDEPPSALWLACAEDGDLRVVDAILAEYRAMDPEHTPSMEVIMRPHDGMTPMYYACTEGRVDIVQRLHAFGASLRVRSRPHKMSPLYGACMTGKLRVAQYLVKMGASKDLLKLTSMEETPYFTACAHGHLDIVTWLEIIRPGGETLRELRHENTQGQIPLFAAVMNGQYAMAQHLCSAGVVFFGVDYLNAIISSTDEDGKTLMHAAAAGNSEQLLDWVASLCEDDDIDIHAEDNNGGTPLTTACYFGSVKSARWLISHGADAFVRKAIRRGSRTPMYIACLMGKFEMVRFLYTAGAAPDVRTMSDEGITPFAAACSAFGDRGLDTAKWLFACTDAKADISFADTRGRTPLYMATAAGNIGTARWLGEVGATADVRTLDAEGRSPLSVACEHAEFECALWLVENGGACDTSGVVTAASLGDVVHPENLELLHLLQDARAMRLQALAGLDIIWLRWRRLGLGVDRGWGAMRFNGRPISLILAYAGAMLKRGAVYVNQAIALFHCYLFGGGMHKKDAVYMNQAIAAFHCHLVGRSD